MDDVVFAGFDGGPSGFDSYGDRHGGWNASEFKGDGEGGASVDRYGSAWKVWVAGVGGRACRGRHDS